MIFLKLGGSLITDKTSTEAARFPVIQRLAGEIADARNIRPGLKILLGHGSGSFGHRAAQRYQTHQGAQSQDDWLGFSEVGAAANRLHRIVCDSMRAAGLPTLSLPPSSTVTTSGGDIETYAIESIVKSLEHNLLPIVHGDVAFDNIQGSSIVSTEQIMHHLATFLRPERILIAGKTAGIQDHEGRILPQFSIKDLEDFEFDDPDGADVTGGMKSKVSLALKLATTYPDMEVLIFSAEDPGVLKEVLIGGQAGTRILPH